jgi:CBS domain containing-hemolysin-like protein
VGEPAIATLVEPLLTAIGIESAATVHGVSLVVAFSAITFLHVVIGEQAPKSLGIMKPEEVTLWSAWPMRAFYWLTYPAIATLNGSANWLLRLLGLPPASEHEHVHSPEELSMAVETSHEHGLLDAQQRTLVDNALSLSTRCVREIMVPRPDMHCLFVDQRLENNLERLREHQHTRYPLARGDVEKIVGMVHVKDLLAFAEHGGAGPAPPLGEETITKVGRPITFVPEVATIDRVLRTFQLGGSHMAVVVDEWGGVAGLVTLEDVLEELVGDIRDEFDVDGGDGGVQRGPGGVLLVDGALPLAEARDEIGLEAADASVDTIGGYVVQRLGRVAKIGDAVRVGRWRAEVVRMRRMRITRVRLIPESPEPELEEGAGGA